MPSTEQPVEWISEYLAAREDVALFDRSDRARIRLGGTDRLTWLQGMVSNDVRPLEAGASRVQAFLLDATGHVQAEMAVVRAGDALIVDTDRSTGARVCQTFERFIILEDVVVEEISAETACLSVQGPSATGPWLHAALSSLQPIAVAQADHSGAGGFDIYLPSAISEQARASLVQAGAIPAGDAAAEALRIEAGIPRFGSDMDEQTLAMETGLESTHVSHSKGCYIGQEIVARIHSRGHTNRLLTGFVHQSGPVPAAGESLVSEEGKEVGRLTSVAWSPLLGRRIALGYLRHTNRREMRPLRASGGGLLEPTELPFRSGEGYPESAP